MKLAFLTLFLLIGMQITAFPEIPDILIDVQIVALPEAEALRLIPDLLDRKKVDGAFERLQRLLLDRSATLVGWPNIRAMNGIRAVIECVEEVQYPTEFEAGDGPAAAPVPVEFETRNAGVTLLVEPVLNADGETVHLHIEMQHVRFGGRQAVEFEWDGGRKRGSVDQPVFRVHKTDTSLKLQSGQRKLLGAYRISETAGVMELFILRVVVEIEPQSP